MPDIIKTEAFVKKSVAEIINESSLSRWKKFLLKKLMPPALFEAPPTKLKEIQKGVVRKRERKLKPMWADVLCFFGGKDQVSSEEVQQYADQKKYNIKEVTLRGQLYCYVNSGWLERISPGVFKLTDAGAQKCGYVNFSGISKMEEIDNA